MCWLKNWSSMEPYFIKNDQVEDKKERSGGTRTREGA